MSDLGVSWIKWCISFTLYKIVLWMTETKWKQNRKIYKKRPQDLIKWMITFQKFNPPCNFLKEKENFPPDFLLGHSMNLPVLNHSGSSYWQNLKNDRRHFQVPGFSLAMGFYAEKFCRRIEISTNSQVFPNKIRLFLIVFTVSKWWATILPDLGEKEINRLQLNCIYLLI